MATLEHIKISGLKSIREIDLPLRLLNILIGPNGAGKSHVIIAFKMIKQMIERWLQLFVGRSGRAQALLYGGLRTTSQLMIELNFGQNGYSTIPPGDDTLVFAQEYDQFHRREKHPGPYSQLLGAGQT